MTAIAITATQTATIESHVVPVIQDWWQDQNSVQDQEPKVTILSIHSDRKSGGLIGVSFRIEVPEAFAQDAAGDEVHNQWTQLEDLFLRLQSQTDLKTISFYAGLITQSETKHFINFTASLRPARGSRKD